MSILKQLLNKEKWQEFLDYKTSKSNLTKTEEKNLIDFVENQKYTDVAKKIVEGTYVFSVPTKTFINKSGATKKRVVYSFSECENIILKFITFLLSKYDFAFSDNCYSFRKNYTVKKALYNIVKTENIDNMYAYKVDISNYFNSIDIKILLQTLHKVINDDEDLFVFIKNLLTEDKSLFKGEVITEKRGVMAGTSLSTFLANVYLMDLDKYFEENGILYARYSDDIIVFAQNEEELDKHRNKILSTIKDKNLFVNASKENYFAPGQPWNFLGFEYCMGEIDLSPVAIKKIKDKIRRKARSLYRWKVKNNKTTEHVVKVIIRIFNSKFYKRDHLQTLSWCRWYFPVITTHKSLKLIDEYLLSYIRYLSTGKFTKKNFNVTYNQIKQNGFKSLVNEYYKYKTKKEEA